MKRKTIWQVAVRYLDRNQWRTHRLSQAYETKRAALDMATLMQQRQSVVDEPERWFVAPITLISAKESMEAHG